MPTEGCYSIVDAETETLKAARDSQTADPRECLMEVQMLEAESVVVVSISGDDCRKLRRKNEAKK